MSFISFCKRNLGLFNLAIVSNLEYRFNFFLDAIAQPTLNVMIEFILWIAVFKGASSHTIGGFTQEYYFAYSLWAAFFARIAINWMYEYRMLQEIETGSVNSLIVRPISFYEYYFSQLMGYKAITSLFSLLVPLAASQFFNFPLHLERIPIAIGICFYYLVLIHSLGFLVCTLAFYFTRVHSFIIVKNLSLGILSGEIIPLDLMPEPFRSTLIHLPFSSGVFIPVGYLTGRLGFQSILDSFYSITISLFIVNFLGMYMWKKGLKQYSGIGA